MKKPNPLFKPYLKGSASYLGGKSINEVTTKAAKLHKLSSNENPLSPSPKAVEAIKKAVDNLHIYPDRTDLRLRNALSTYYDHSLAPDQFLAANSGSECLQYIVQAFVSPGTECIITSPAFGLYAKLIKWSGGNLVDVPLIGDTFQLDVDNVLSHITDKTRLIFLTSPNNPTGTYIPKDRLQVLLDGIPDHVVVIYDEVYYLFADASDNSIAMPFVQDGHRIIGLNSFSKSYGLAGLRLGYCYSTAELISYIRSSVRPFLINSMSLEAGLAALEDHDYLDSVVSLIREEKSYLYSALDSLSVQYWKSQGNFVMFKVGDDSTTLVDHMLLESGVMVRPVDNFGAAGSIRVTIGTHEANQAFVEGLKKYLSV